MVTPFSLPISAVRFSHSTASNGAVLPSVKYRLNTRPVLSPEVCSGLTPVCSDLPFNAVLTVAMYSPRSRAPPRGGGHPYYTPPHFRGGAARSPNGGNLTRWLVGFQSKKFRPRLAVEIVENECKTQRPAAGRCCCYHTAFTAALLRFACGHEAGVRARLVCLEPGWSRGPRTRINILDPVRLALPRSPESGIAVSSCAKILSREKRKMWVPYKENVLSVVVSFRAHNPFLQRVWYANAKNFRERGIFTRCSCRVNWQRLLFLAHGMISSS